MLFVIQCFRYGMYFYASVDGRPLADEYKFYTIYNPLVFLFYCVG